MTPPQPPVAESSSPNWWRATGETGYHSPKFMGFTTAILVLGLVIAVAGVVLAVVLYSRSTRKSVKFSG